jgi:hypothetical protein
MRIKRCKLATVPFGIRSWNDNSAKFLGLNLSLLRHTQVGPGVFKSRLYCTDELLKQQSFEVKNLIKLPVR